MDCVATMNRLGSDNRNINLDNGEEIVFGKLLD